MPRPESPTTNCWCLSCEPSTGEIGLECRKVMRGNLSAEDFITKLFEDPGIKAVYERLAKR